MAIEQLLILIKPDGIKKSLTGNILTKLSEARMLIIGAKTVKVSKELAEQHYYQLKDKSFFGELADYIQGLRRNQSRMESRRPDCPFI